ncbi:hypothetical protein [Streptomyces apocyni]|uniref:hypothetical protein n=1 Tax=Streptomyces apocyni TaxID=2654677 RepID=UPI0012EA9FD8|nr:hypothetical protein [Streptomyces apocyni]
MGRLRDAGAATLEYAAVLALIAAIAVAAFATPTGAVVAERAHCAVLSIVGQSGGGCGGSDGDGGGSGDQADGGGRTDEDYRPTDCQVGSSTETVSNQAKVLWFTVGDKHQFRMEEFNVEGPNGEPTHTKKYQMTFADGVSAGLEFKAGFGAKADLGGGGGGGGNGDGNGDGGGGAGGGAGGTVKVGGGLEFSEGDTWVFDSKEEADRFKGDLRRLHEADQSNWTKPGWRIIRDTYREHVSGSNKEIRERLEREMDANRVSFRTVQTNAGVEANLAGPALGDLEVGASGKLEVASSVTTADDAKAKTTTETYAFQLRGELGAELDAGVAEAGAYAGHTRNGAIGVTRGQDDGDLQKIVITRTVDTKARADAGVTLPDGEGGEGADGGDASGSGSLGVGVGVGANMGETEVVTTTLEIPKGPEGDAMRAVAERWLNDPDHAAKPFETAFMDPAPTTRPDRADAFGNPLFEHAKTTRATYDSVEDSASFGFELNAMASLGFDRTINETTATIRSGDYLGMPQGDNRRYQRSEICG